MARPQKKAVYCRKCSRRVYHGTSIRQGICGTCNMEDNRRRLLSANDRKALDEAFLKRLSGIKLPAATKTAYEQMKKLNYGGSYTSFARMVRTLTKQRKVSSKLMIGKQGGRRRVIYKVNGGR